MITLYRCGCGKFKRYGVGIVCTDLESNERRMFNDLIKSGEYLIAHWTCPECRLQGSRRKTNEGE